MIQAVKWTGNSLQILDQTLLPFTKKYVNCRRYQDVVDAIKKMKVRGAPAIGITAAYGIALAARKIVAKDTVSLGQKMEKVFSDFAASRPTAVNLFWAIERMRKTIHANPQRKINILRDVLVREAQKIADEDIAMNQVMGKLGAEFIREGDGILTHCNTGALATGGYGTGLGVIRAAHSQGKKITVYVDETRPYLQGSRLTAWELKEENIPFYLITDNMAGHFMQQGAVKVVVVGSDRIVANGDVANKIGTYSLAVLAWEHRIPFYVVAPTSTIDMNITDGGKIPVEQRDPEEVTSWMGKRVAPKGIRALYPAFDVTPSRYVSAIITERGVVRAPYNETLKKLMDEDSII